MITCETCGEIMPDGTQFCPNCGTPVSTAASPKPDDVTPTVPDAPLPENHAASEAPPQNTAAPSQPQSGSMHNGTQSIYVQQPTGQYNYQQPNYGQTNYGQANYGQANYGQSSPNQQNAYGQPNYTQPNYGQPPYTPYPSYYPQQAQPSDGKTVASLILGIMSILFGCAYGFGVIFGIVGLVLANSAKKSAEQKGVPLSGSNASNASAGKICSIIGIIVSALTILCFVLLFVIAGISATEDFNTYDYASRFFFH